MTERNTEYLRDWVYYHQEHALHDYEELKKMVREDERLAFVTNHPAFDGFDELDDVYDKTHRQYKEASDRIDELVDMGPDQLADEVNEDPKSDALWERLDDEVTELEAEMGNAKETFGEAFEEFFEDFL